MNIFQLKDIGLKNTLFACASVLLACISAAPLLTTSACAQDLTQLTKSIQAEEVTLQARIGMAVFDANTGQTWQYRGEEHFPLNSTHKALTCAALLAKVDEKSLSLTQPVLISKDMVVTYSPITKKSLAPKAMTLGEICHAAVSYSDNTAANVAFDAIGGPTGFTTYMRSIGDDTTQLERKEPELNEATPGDMRDTTTPDAIVKSLHKILLGNVLSPASREQLTQWMLDDQVAGPLLRAALPSDWKIADKSGAGGYGSRSIIAVIWPPAKQPLVTGIYITQTKAPMEASNKAIARIGTALKEAVDQ